MKPLTYVGALAVALTLGTYGVSQLAQSSFPAWTTHTTLTAFLGAEQTRIDANGPGLNTFVPLSNADIYRASTGLRLMMVGDVEAGAKLLRTLGYVIYTFAPSDGKLYYVVREPDAPPTGFKALGTIIINRKPKRAVTITAPHVNTDGGTQSSSRRYFEGLDAWVMAWEGAERCNSTEFSPCTGTTSLCGGGTTAYRQSDSTSFNRTMMQAVALASREADVDAVLDVHSNATDERHLIMGSGGTTARPAGAETLLVNRVRNRIALDSPAFTFGSCNSASDPRSTFQFCGATQPIGRVMNNVSHTASCTTYASDAAVTGRFIQLEEQSTLYNTSANYNKVIAALQAEIPLRW